MSDIQGDRPDDSTPAPSPEGDLPVTDGQDAGTPAAADVPAASGESAIAEAPAAAAAFVPAAIQPAAPATPEVAASEVAASVADSAPAAPQTEAPAPAEWQSAGAPALPTQPAHAGYQSATPYAGAGPQSYDAPSHPAGQPYATGSAFGAPQGLPYANQTQPTLPLADAALAQREKRAPKKAGLGVGGIVGVVLAAALVGGAAGLGGAYAGVNLWAPQETAPPAGPTTVTVNNPDSVNATTAIAAKALPSVVTIEVSGDSEASGDGAGGTGSGVILTEDGYIATNTHVVTLDGATADPNIRVTTSDGHVYDAEIVGTDPTYDLAVIKLDDAEGLTPMEFADSSKLNVGDQTVAIGAPLGLPNTVTTGIVSTLNRSIQIASSAAPESEETPDEDAPDEGDEGDEGGDNGQNGPFKFDIPGQNQPSVPTSSISIAVVQTDAAINPGNSGGALVNGKGELIGINVAIATAGGTSTGQAGSIGVGFSIPSNIVQRVTKELIKNGEATHGLLGATVRPAASVEDADITGAYIEELAEGGAAEKAGLREEDIVTMFNGVPISDSIDLTAQVRAAAAGSEATLTYVRDGESQTANLTLGELQQ